MKSPSSRLQKKISVPLGGTHAFDFKFSQKPNYTVTNINTSVTSEHSAYYESLDVNSNSEFLSFVSGMTQLVGDFGRILVDYAVNQTNHFTY